VSPSDHYVKTGRWEKKWHVTASSFNNVHHKSQREYFDRPIEVPKQGYAHERLDKMEAMQTYASKTPMRSVKHCKQLLDCFRMIEEDKNELRSPKRGYGYQTKEELEVLATGFTVANDYGHIPGLRGGQTIKYPDMPNRGYLSPAPPRRQSLNGSSTMSKSGYMSNTGFSTKNLKKKISKRAIKPHTLTNTSGVLDQAILDTDRTI